MRDLERIQVSVPRALQVLLATCTLLSMAGCRLKGDGAESTISPDRRQFPRGVVIPPAGFGVDLVREKGKPRRTVGTADTTVLPASTASR